MKPRPHLTHLALRVRDVGATVDFYQRYGGLHVVHEREDDGVRVVWLSEQAEDPSFVIVFIGTGAGLTRPADLGNHLGYDLPSRAAVDEVAARARAEGILLQGPVYAGPIVGYFCMVRDPDGNVIEFSHGQPIKPKEVNRNQ
jgi:catechol 2,3-dioxygenase-like lactoylglutathione lyase family enzyme